MTYSLNSPQYGKHMGYFVLVVLLQSYDKTERKHDPLHILTQVKNTH